MTPERWKLVRKILDHALDLEPSERPASLEELCGDDETLRWEVEELLATENAANLNTEPFFSVRAPSQQEGRRLGAYRILREIGRGGMGAVYLAAREDDFEKQAAVKLLKRGMDSDEIVARFKTERQILARLEHPHIARLLDGGSTEDGLPYFVMEHVDGEPIDRYCHARRFDVWQRLELFRKVCSGVQFAHQSLVVHRDLKPSNILVAADGSPKLLDFGIAKILDPGPQEQLTLTWGPRPMTPEYASPEQIRGDAVTTASDVYSLGVLLLEILAGCRQLDSPALRGLDRDLVNIVRTAMHEEPALRYGSVERLSEDVLRYLQGFPVLATGGNRIYQIRKFIRRHALGTAMTAALAIVVVGFGVVTAVLWQRAVEEREDAIRAEHRANKVSDFLEELFRESDPKRHRGTPPTVRDLLDRGRDRIRENLEGDPETRAALMETMGRVYRDLAIYEEARALLGESLKLRRETFGDNHPLVARSLHNLAFLFLETAAPSEAAPLLTEALSIQRRHGSRDDPDFVHGLTNLAAFHEERGDIRRAEELYREALELKRRRFGNDHPEFATALNNLGALLIQAGELEEGAHLVRRSYEIRLAVHGETSLGVAKTANNLGQSFERAGRLEEAEEYYRESLSIRRRIFATPHPHLALALNNLASCLKRQGKYQRAEELYQEALAFPHEKLTPQIRAVILRNLAALLAARGFFADCRKKVEKALVLYRQAARAGPETNWRVADARSVLGECLVGLGLYDEAEPLLAESYSTIRRAKGDLAQYTRDAKARLDQLEDARRRAMPAMATGHRY